MSKSLRCKGCGRMTLNLSWSRLRSHMECRQRGYLQRAGLGKKLENVRGYFAGTVTDRVVRNWLLLEHPEDNLGLMPEMVESILVHEAEEVAKEGKKLIWKDLSDRDNVIKECIEAVTKIEPSLLEKVLPYDYDVDFRFKAVLELPHPAGYMESVILRGFMDIITRDDDGKFSVWDVKHTRDNYYWKKTKGQLSFYDLAVEIMFGAPTVMTGLLQPLCDERVKEFPLENLDRTLILSHVIQMAEDIWAENFEPNAPASECFYCNVKHACSKFAAVGSEEGKKRVKLI